MQNSIIIYTVVMEKEHKEEREREGISSSRPAQNLLGTCLGSGGVAVEGKVVDGAGGKTGDLALEGESSEAGGESSRCLLALESQDVGSETSNVGGSHGGTGDGVLFYC